MEPLLKQLRDLPGKLPLAVKLLVVLALAGLAGAAAIFSAASTESYQYAFTNLTAEDSSEAAGTLKSAGIPFRMEAGGTALAVPGWQDRHSLASSSLRTSDPTIPWRPWHCSQALSRPNGA